MAHEDLLAQTEFFADAPQPVLASIAAAGHEQHLIRGDVLFHEGDIADSLYLVLRGRMAIAIANPIDHRETVVALMEPGDLLGEMAMLDGGPRSAMARALEPSAGADDPVRAGDGRCSATTRGCCGASPACWLSGCASPTRHSPTACSSTSPGAPPSDCWSCRRASTTSSCPSLRKSWPAWSAPSRERVNKAIASFIRLGWIDQHERKYTILKRDSLDIRAR